jgi:hypothetical protein
MIKTGPLLKIGRNLLGFIFVFCVVLLAVLLLFGLWLFRTTLFPILLGALFAAFIFIAVSKLVKSVRLRKARQNVQDDPVNPDAHLRLSWAYYSRNIAGPSVQERLQALASFRNAIQLDLNLDIKRADTAIRKFIRLYAGGRRREEFIVLLSYLAAIEYHFEEFERRHSSELANEIVNRKYEILSSPVFDFDERLDIVNRIVRDLALAFREQNTEPWLDSLAPSPGDSTYTARRTLGILLDFHEELLRLLRSLIRALGQIS